MDVPAHRVKSKSLCNGFRAIGLKRNNTLFALRACLSTGASNNTGQGSLPIILRSFSTARSAKGKRFRSSRTIRSIFSFSAIAAISLIRLPILNFRVIRTGPLCLIAVWMKCQRSSALSRSNRSTGMVRESSVGKGEPSSTAKVAAAFGEFCPLSPHTSENGGSLDSRGLAD